MTSTSSGESGNCPRIWLRRLRIVFAIALTLAPATTPAAPPNIVLITSDDQNFRDYGFTGSGSVLDVQGNPIRPFTPTLDAWFASGVTYSMGHSPIAVCRPSLASIFTGLNPVQSGTYGNDPVVNGVAQGWGKNQNTPYNDILRRNVELNATLPRILSERGYATLQTGKWWEGEPRRGGFTHAEPTYETTNADRHLHNYLDNGAGSIGRMASSVTGRIGAFIDQAISQRQPFFVSYAPFLPHSPFNAPAAYSARYAPDINSGRITAQQAGYLACVDWFDATLAELNTLLQSKGVLNDTLIIFVADNGWLMPRTGTVPSYGANGGKMTPFQNGVRTPIFFYQPGRITDSRSIAEKLADPRLASSTDIMPTVLRLVGAEVPDVLQGVDLLSPNAPRRRRVFGDTYLHDQDVLVGNQYRIGNPEASLASRWMIEDNWKLILVTRNPSGQSIGASVQLYNLSADPLETTNLAVQHAARAAAMSVTLEQWWTATRPTYLLAHEFNGSATSLSNVVPDVRDASVGQVAWSSSGSALNNGTLSGTSLSRLAFTPVSKSRYELRAALKPTAATHDGVALAFMSDDPDPTRSILVGARLTRSVSGLIGVELVTGLDQTQSPVSMYNFGQVPAGSLYSVGVVLDTSDHDVLAPGEQWASHLIVNGIRRFTFSIPARPSIRGVGIAGLGASNAASVDHLSLVRVGLMPDAVTAPIVDGDLDSNGRVDVEDLYRLNQNLIRDVNRDGAVDSTDIQALSDFLQSQR